MKSSCSPLLRVVFAALVLSVAGTTRSHALQARSDVSRFDSIALPDPSVAVSPAPIGARSGDVDAAIPDSLRAGWSSFKALHGKKWDVTIDARSGVPLLVQGEGIPLIPGSANSLQAAAPVTLDSLAALLRSFVTTNASLSKSDEAELALNREGSGPITPELWKVVFDRSVAGIPVAGDRWIFYVGHGNLIAFGASRWSSVTTSSLPFVSSEGALAALFRYMGITQADRPEIHDAGTLLFVPRAAAGSEVDSYAGSVGAGYDSALAWRFVVEVPGEPGRWSALVDAHSGTILALDDTIQYAQAKGGVLPITSDEICPDGCEQPNFPMPFANISIAAAASTTSSMGSFACTPAGATATTTLAGPFVRVVDGCGAIAQSVTCNADLDLRSSSGTDCTVPAGASAGDTHASRSSFYHLNRIKEHARAWLPANSWLPLQLRDNVNLNQSCNAFWSSAGLSGTVNFYRSGGGCRNTGEIASVVLHEWGHGLDQNDGGGYDNPSEAYADVTSFLLNHKSCIGRGFRSSNCSGYGNACLSCTGVRDQDWDQHATHAPQTPENWPGGCPAGSGPCGREVHCEAYLSGQAVWDLAVRDLPASGLDAQTSWQIADRLWFQSRTGSGGNAYSCGATVTSRSCAASSWYTQFRTLDDDDGNLANGTPHAAAIFTAFNRHNIPCGTASDATNQNHTSCPPLPAPVLTTSGSAGQIALSWTPVPGASSYNVLRNDQGCDWGHTLIANVAGTSYSDTDLPDLFPLYYAIQPVGPVAACVGTLSPCTSALAGAPHAVASASARVADTCSSDAIADDDSIYDPGEEVRFSLTLRNDGAATLTGVTATLAPITPGVTMVSDSASYGPIAVGASAVSNAPHFTARIPVGLACGSSVGYTLTIQSNEGTWSEPFAQTVGLVDPGLHTPLSEDFSAGIPGSWTVVDGGSGGGAAATWTTANPASRTFSAPLTSPVAIVDSFGAGSMPSTIRQDEQLITPALDLSAATSVTLDYDEFFRWNIGSMDEKGDVDVTSSLTKGAWVNVVRNQGASNPVSGTATGAAHRTVNISAQAAGATGVQLRFHYYNAYFEFWWEVDNVVVSYAVPPSCTMHPCIARADLGVTSSGPATAAAGQDIAYTVTVENAGPDAAAGVHLSNAIPADTVFRSLDSPGGWSCSAPAVGETGTIACSAASLAVSDVAAFTIVVGARSCAGDGALIASTATVSTGSSDLESGNDIATATTTLTDDGACDDGDMCTSQDACASGVCGGAPVEVPAEVAHLEFTSKTVRAWDALAVAGPAVVYDVARGRLGQWPVGSGASELCQASGIDRTDFDTADDPEAGEGFWYLVRGRSECGAGSYGSASGGAARVTLACP